MDPYQPPVAKSESSEEILPPDRGAPCRACGSFNTTKDKLLRSKASVISVILFGWIVLLLKAAFHVRTSECRDCGESRRYKTTGSKVALGFVIFFVLLLALAIFEEYS